MRIYNSNIVVDIDPKDGNTIGIYNPNDSYKMNWILQNSKWGVFEGFDIIEVKRDQREIVIILKNKSRQFELTVEKKIIDDKYQEHYHLKNISNQNLRLNKDDFGINFPYDCIFQNKKNTIENSCITHVWCGGDVAWMYSVKPSGRKPYLVCYCSKGSFSDYSLNYDVSRVTKGCDYRGDIVWHLTECEIAAGESIEFVLNYQFANESPDNASVGLFCDMRMFADKYSGFIGEEINCYFEAVDDLSGLEIFCGEDRIEYELKNNMAVWKISSDVPGELKISAKLHGKQTWMCLNILDKLEVILQKRAKFITEKQQYSDNGVSNLDGAYLIYDREKDVLICDSSFLDHNACRERLSMGTVVALALQYNFDDDMMESLKRHRKFVEREVFDVESAIVYNDIHRNNQWHRAYNYAWMSDYYLEWYNLTKEKQCIIYAARIMINYYDQANGIRQVSPCMRMTDICRALEKEELYELKNVLINRVCAHAERIMKEGDLCYSEEVSCTQGFFIGKIELLCQAYLITGKEEYLTVVLPFLERVNSFCAKQPDFHMNDIAVRYWDLFWFGKTKMYGDTMPQWLGAWAGVVYNFIYKCGFGVEFKNRAENNLKNNLCVFDNIGFGSAAYLAPYKVVQYSSNSNYHNAYLSEGMVYGHKYDDYANDQDWALYFAVKELEIF